MIFELKLTGGKHGMSWLTSFTSLPARFGERTILTFVPVVIALLLLSCASFASAKDSTVDSSALQRITEAESAEYRGDWPAAIGLLTTITTQSPDNGRFRLMLAQARFSHADYAAAASDYKIALDLNAGDPATLNYMIAKCYALQKNADLAMHWLKAAITLGYRNLEEARADEAFALLRDNPEYRDLLGIIDASKMSRDDGWRYDIRFLSDWIEKKSYHPFRTDTGDRYASQSVLTRHEFETAVAQLTADVPTLTDSRIEAELFRLVASLGDGHTELAGSRRRIEFAMTMPLGFYVFDDGLFVISAAPQYRELVGAKVTALDDTPTEIALRKIDALISHDNAMWVRTMEPHFLRHVPFLKELGIVRDGSAVELTVQTKEGQRKMVRVASDPTAPDIWNILPKPTGWVWIGDANRSDYQRRNGDPYWWSWDSGDQILYVQYNKVIDGEKQTLADFAKEVADAIDQHPVSKVVIDMRNNNGGNTFLNETLLQVVARSGKVNRRGHLYVIIGRRTFSAAMNAVSYFGKYTAAVFVGEPTGGKPNSPGDETFFTLPYSGIMVNLSDRYWQGTWPDDFSDWRAPDIAAPVTFVDYAAGRDAAMEVIKAQAAPK
jgi:tetratricopeptide (TPR) repeat protein